MVDARIMSRVPKEPRSTPKRRIQARFKAHCEVDKRTGNFTVRVHIAQTPERAFHTRFFRVGRTSAELWAYAERELIRLGYL